MSDAEQTPGMARALQVFLASGFHGATIGDLETATGLSWETIQARFTDKEGLFYAALDAELGPNARDDLTPDELMAMLSRLERANGNPRLRAIHKQAILRVARLAEGPDAASS